VAESVAAAVQRYDMTTQARAELVQKARLLQPDGIIVIQRDGITSTDGVATDLKDMHHGKPGRVCKGPVVRDKWRDNQAETALVYCAHGECIAVPVICGNVSRVTFTPFAAPKEPEFRAWVPDSPSANSEPAPAVPRGPALQPAPNFAPTPKAAIVQPMPMPEPSALLLAATAIGLLVWGRRN
jgi:hypothetical protein